MILHNRTKLAFVWEYKNRQQKIKICSECGGRIRAHSDVVGSTPNYPPIQVRLLLSKVKILLVNVPRNQ